MDAADDDEVGVMAFDVISEGEDDAENDVVVDGDVDEVDEEDEEDEEKEEEEEEEL